MDAPSLRLNHEEVEKALEEGIFFAENLEPVEINTDAHGHVESVLFRHGLGETATLPARAVLIAAGTSPNTVLAREEPNFFVLDGKFFRAINSAGERVQPERSPKPEVAQMLLHMQPDGRAISFFGDLHPSFAGNVVKAMASAKRGYKQVSHMLNTSAASGGNKREDFIATAHSITRLTPTIVELVLHAPLAAARFEPGQFYRLQNFEANAHKTANSTLAMEGLAMTGAWVDKERGLIAVIALEMGGSSDLCAHVKPGEKLVLMGPTGVPTELPAGETVLLAGGGLGNAVLFSIGKGLRALGSNVLYFAGYKKAIDRYKVADIEAAADVVVWCCDEPSDFTPNRAQDFVFHGNIVQAMRWYGEIVNHPIALSSVNRLIAIGSDRMMQAVAEAQRGVLHPYLNPHMQALGSINSPMQCMMKEICAQCLQRHVHPQTGEVSYVYSCANQDQPLDYVDFSHLRERLKQNTLAEKQTALWVDRSLKTLGLR